MFRAKHVDKLKTHIFYQIFHLSNWCTIRFL